MKKIINLSLFLMLLLPRFALADTITHRCGADMFNKQYRFNAKLMINMPFSFITQHQKMAVLGLTDLLASIC